MKHIIVTLAAIALLSACAAKQPVVTKEDARPPLFYKDGVSDSKMTEDLNDCAEVAFKMSAENDSAKVTEGKYAAKKKCMTGKGYEVFYN